MLKAFKIKKLFGEFDVNLSFRKGANIFVGENGCGKTTILNCLYYILTSNFEKLAKINFEEIELILDKKPPIKFSKIEMLKNKNSSIELAFRDKLIEITNSTFEYEDILNIKSLYEKKDEMNKLKSYIDILSNNTSLPTSYIEKELERIVNRILKDEKINMLKNFKDTYPIVYFPTYRRIEQDEHDLGLDFDETTIRGREYMRRANIRRLRQNNLLIQFGMSDVETMIDNLLNEIGRNAVKSFQDMAATLVNQYLDDKQKQKRIKNLDRDKLSTILSRIDKISKETKNTILNLLEEKKLKDKQELVRLLSNLIEAYDNQKEQDDNIKNFCDVCNKYLRNKAFYYDENNLSLKILKNENKKEIEMKDLSSGEKQIISIFSKLYLDNTNRNCIILFDEPELSISLDWQKTLITDIMNSKKCSLLIAVTHSPFIFDNEKLFKITRSIEETFKK